jgi:hypothetical protein
MIEIGLNLTEMWAKAKDKISKGYELVSISKKGEPTSAFKDYLAQLGGEDACELPD